MRFRLTAAAVVVAIVVACALWWARARRPAPAAPKTAAASAPAASAATAGGAPMSRDQIETDIIRSGLTPDRAKLLFSMVVGRLPGVTVTAPPSKDPADFDGTLAVDYIFRVWSSLTPEQQRVAARAIGTPPASASARSQAAPRESASPAIVQAAFRRRTSPQPTFDYHKLLKDADGTLAAMLNVPGISFAEEVDYDPPTVDEWAHTNSWWQVPVLGDWKIYPGSGCHVFIHDQRFWLASAEDAQAVMTHEMLHCFQEREAVTYDQWATVPPWLSEGEATWAMAVVVPGAQAYAKHWKTYAQSPETVYYGRVWDGVGIFGHISDIAGDSAIWPKLLPMVKESINTPHGEDAFADLIAGNEPQYFSSWGSSYFLEPDKTPWTMLGPGHPPKYGVTAEALFVPVGARQNLSVLPAYESHLYHMSTDADVLVVALLSGYGRLHDDGFGLDTVLDTSGVNALCVKPGGCTCPDGSPGASLFTQRATAPVSVGLNGGDTNGQLAVIGKSLDEFCKKPDPGPDPGPAPGGGGGGAAAGTTHRTPTTGTTAGAMTTPTSSPSTASATTSRWLASTRSSNPRRTTSRSRCGRSRSGSRRPCR